MRKVFGSVLVAIGVAGILLAILLPTVVASTAIKTPLDLDITQVSSGSAQLLDAESGKVQTVDLRATRIVRTDSKASDGTNTVVEESLCIVVVEGDTPNCLPSSDPRLLSVTTDRAAFDRKTGAAVNTAKYTTNVDKDTSVQHVGLGYKWPFDAQKKTYMFFQPDVGKAFPATFDGVDKVGGLTTYRYVSRTGQQDYKIKDTLPGTYDDTRTVWVEPRTGVIVKGQEKQTQTLESGQVALDTTLNFDQSAIDYQTKFAKDSITKIDIVEKWGPLAAGIIGVIALVGGVLLLRGDRTEGGRAAGGRRRAGDDTPRPPVDEQPA